MDTSKIIKGVVGSRYTVTAHIVKEDLSELGGE